MGFSRLPRRGLSAWALEENLPSDPSLLLLHHTMRARGCLCGSLSCSHLCSPTPSIGFGHSSSNPGLSCPCLHFFSLRFSAWHCLVALSMCR